jgi:hypothetical protein
MGELNGAPGKESMSTLTSALTFFGLAGACIDPAKVIGSPVAVTLELPLAHGPDVVDDRSRGLTDENSAESCGVDELAQAGDVPPVWWVRTILSVSSMYRTSSESDPCQYVPQ